MVLTLMVPKQHRGSLVQVDRRVRAHSGRYRDALGRPMDRQFSSRCRLVRPRRWRMLYGGVCWVLMLELGGLADARPIHINNSVQQEYQSQCQWWSETEVLVTAYLLHPIWCGPYFNGVPIGTGLSKVRPTLLWSDLLRGRTETLTTCKQ